MQPKLYESLQAVEQDIKTASDNQSYARIVDGISRALKSYDYNLEHALINNTQPQESWTLDVLGRHREWTPVCDAFKAVAENKKQILINANGTLSKRHIPGLMKQIKPLLDVAADEFQQLRITEHNISDAVTLVYIILGQYKKAIEEDQDTELQAKTQALIRYSGFNRQQVSKPLYMSLQKLVNTNPLLRSKIPDSLVAPSEAVKAQLLIAKSATPAEEVKPAQNGSEKDKLLVELKLMESSIQRLRTSLQLYDDKIADAQRRQHKHRNDVVFSTEETKQLEELNNIDISNGVVLFDGELAEKCRLCPEEERSWSQSSDAYHGSYTKPISYLRQFTVWTGTDGFVKLTPFVGNYIAGSSLSPAKVMQKLKNMLQESNEKKRADEDYLHATQQRDAIYVDLTRLETDRQAKILQLGQYEEQEREQQLKEEYKKREDRFTFKINQLFAPVQNQYNNQFQYYLLLIKVKVQILRLDVPENHEFHAMIKEKIAALDAKIKETMQRILASYDVNYNYQAYFNDLINIKNTLHGIRFDIPEDLLRRIQQLRARKAWDDTYEVYRANQRINFKHYFMGVPKNEGRLASYIVSWVAYVALLGFVLIPLKNILKLVTEFTPKRLEAHCQNKIEQAEQHHSTNAFAVFGRFFFRLLYLLLRPITSPIKAFCGCCISDSSTPASVRLQAEPGIAPTTTSSAAVSRQLSTTTATHSVATVLIQAERPIEEAKPVNKDIAASVMAEDRQVMVSPKLF